MKVCYYAWSSYTKFSIEIHREILTKGIDYSAFFVVNNSEERDKVLKSFPEAKIYLATEFLEKNHEAFTVLEFIKCEKRFGIDSLWGLILSDRFLYHQPHDYVIKIATGYLKFFEMIFSEEHPDFFFNEVIAVFSSYAAYYVGKTYGVKYVAPMAARTHGSSHHYFVTDPFQLNMNFNPNYKLSTFSPHYIEKAREYIEEFELKALKPELMAYTGVRPKFGLSFIKGFISFIIGAMQPKNQYDYINRYNYKYYLNPMIFFFRYQLIKRYFKNGLPDFERKYVFVPLHYQPEASTLVCAAKYEKQLFLIDSLSKSIPSETLIYVKEHYALLGHKQIRFYRELSKYPNVVLIDPWIDSHELIKKSEAVVALTGTAGFEAILYRKPVLLLGRVFYENAPGVIGLKDIYGEYKKALSEWRQPSLEEVELFLTECFETMYPGCVYTILPKVLSRDNIKKVSDSLVNQFIRIQAEI